MIEGLKVTITGTELVSLCADRARYHDSRASFYTAQKEALPEALPDIDENVMTFNNSSKRPEEMMRERIANHNAEAAELRFIANHIKTDESYLLFRDDLSKLGIVHRGY